MIVKTLGYPLSKTTAAELAKFERQFTYPLGSDDRFSISHGSDYLQFFTAMGTATLLIALRNGEVAGTMVLVRRQLFNRERGCGGSLGRFHEAHYICDLKLRPEARSSPALFRMFAAAAVHVRQRRSQSCYGIVMAGTGANPSQYTGRVEIPTFDPIGEIAILRFSAENAQHHAQVLTATPEHFVRCETGLISSGVRPSGGDSSIRSSMPAKRFCHATGAACALLEDTRLVKRLISTSGEEIVSAHLSRFAWSSPTAAANVLRHALAESLTKEYPAVFCSLPVAAWAQLKPLVHDLHYHETSATIFGYGIPAGLEWWIDTSEI